MKSKKALGSLQTIVITIMVLGIVLGIGLLVLEEFESALGTDTTTVVNETVTPTDAGIYVAYNYTTDGVYCYNNFVPTIVINTTDDALISSGNYSYTTATGLLKNLTSEFSAGSWKVTYTYTYGDNEACKGLDETINATKTIPTWLTIIIIMLIVGILLAIVFKVLPTSGEGGGGLSFGGASSGGITAEI